MQMGRSLLGLWFWLWFGLCFCDNEQEQTKLGLGQECGGYVAGRCDTNLTCVPEFTPEAFEEPISGICSRVPPHPQCAPCAEVQCPRKKRLCWSHVTEPCGCCPQCAHLQGQVCGGPHWERGYCNVGLTCTRFLGHAPAKPPETGVCKVLPGFFAHPLEQWGDPNCPWVWGCSVRMSTCQCYGAQTCQPTFRYDHIQECKKDLEEDWRYPFPDEEQEEELKWTCTVYGCEIQDDQCVCRDRSCENPRLPTEDECEELLQRIRCANVTCPIIPVPSCPPDSFLTVPYTPPRQCCPLFPALCTCDFGKCPSKPRDCPPGHHAYVVTRGSGHPGKCCHRYLCRSGEESASQKRDEEEE